MIIQYILRHFAFSCFLLPVVVFATTLDTLPTVDVTGEPVLSTVDSDFTPSFTLDPADKQFRTRMLIASYAVGVGVYGYLEWWGKTTTKNHLQSDGSVISEDVDNYSGRFRVNHEGWFERDSPNGGADKLGHAYSAYISTRLMTYGFEWAGHDHDASVKLASLTSGAIMLGVEIFDGYTVEYGFSPEDLVMNLSGVAAGALLEAYPEWDKIFDIRFKYWRSDDARRLGESDPVSDYSGQTYLLVTKASGIPSLADNWLLRYLEFDLGYGSRGYQPNPGQYVDTQPKERHVYYGISLNLSQVLNDTIFHEYDHNQRSTTQKVADGVLEYLQMPGTALLFDHKF